MHAAIRHVFFLNGLEMSERTCGKCSRIGSNGCMRQDYARSFSCYRVYTAIKKKIPRFKRKDKNINFSILFITPGCRFLLFIPASVKCLHTFIFFVIYTKIKCNE